jgi:hypothetical protein
MAQESSTYFRYSWEDETSINKLIEEKRARMLGIYETGSGKSGGNDAMYLIEAHAGFVRDQNAIEQQIRTTNLDTLITGNTGRQFNISIGCWTSDDNLWRCDLSHNGDVLNYTETILNLSLKCKDNAKWNDVTAAKLLKYTLDYYNTNWQYNVSEYYKANQAIFVDSKEPILLQFLKKVGFTQQPQFTDPRIRSNVLAADLALGRFLKKFGVDAPLTSAGGKRSLKRKLSRRQYAA